MQLGLCIESVSLIPEVAFFGFFAARASKTLIWKESIGNYQGPEYLMKFESEYENYYCFVESLLRGRL